MQRLQLLENCADTIDAVLQVQCEMHPHNALRSPGRRHCTANLGGCLLQAVMEGALLVLLKCLRPHGSRGVHLLTPPNAHRTSDAGHDAVEAPAQLRVLLAEASVDQTLCVLRLPDREHQVPCCWLDITMEHPQRLD